MTLSSQNLREHVIGVAGVTALGTASHESSLVRSGDADLEKGLTDPGGERVERAGQTGRAAGNTRTTCVTREGVAARAGRACLESPMPRGAPRAPVHGVARVGHDLVTKPPPPPCVK